MRRSRWIRFWGLLGAALLWCGIVSIPLGEAIYNELHWKAVFLSGLGLVGIVLLAGAVRAFLALFNPTLEVFVSETIELGSPFELRWRIVGRRRTSVRSLVIRLEGLEETTDTKTGTVPIIEHNVFHAEKIVAANARDQVLEGETSAELPPGGLPSFDAPHNKVIWRLAITGEIPSWPDIDDEFVLAVTPRSRRAVAS